MLRNLACIVLLAIAWSPADAVGLETRLRRPVAMALADDGGQLFVANRESGSISIVDTVSRLVAAEIDLGGRLTDLAALDETHLLALDEANHQLVLLSGRGDQWDVALRQNVAPFPVRLLTDRAKGRCYVASLWSRCVSVVDLSEVDDEPQPRLHVVETLAVAFEPREMCLAADDSRLIVAGAFAASLAVFDTNKLSPVANHRLPGHNIRGLAVTGPLRRLLISQQELNPLGHATQDDVHWGNVVTNELVSLPLFDVCHSQQELHGLRKVTYLGEPGNAAGDPGPIAVAADGSVAVALSGVHEVAILRNGDYQPRRVAVGTGPGAILSATQGPLYVANTFGDSVTIIDPEEARASGEISLGAGPELTPAQRGETLFFDARLSHDGWMSCGSCHTDGHSNGQLNDNLSDGSFGAPKRVLSLLGVADTAPWAWNGKVKTLEEQLENSIRITMQGEAPSEAQIAALAAYLRTLPASPPLVEAPQAAASTEVQHGAQLFDALDCRRCHVPPTFTSPAAYDVGLVDAAGNTQFNPPSLRGVGRRAALFHDGRAKSLAEVVGTFGHQLPRELAAAEREALVRYLETL